MEKTYSRYGRGITTRRDKGVKGGKIKIHIGRFKNVFDEMVRSGGHHTSADKQIWGFKFQERGSDYWEIWINFFLFKVYFSSE